ncbi:MAG: MFS transporter [Bacillota bacterium]|nr:MFS transporter [Bacillota bacterium]
MEQQQQHKLHKWLILFNVSVSVFMATLDGSIVNIALPVMSGKLSVTIESIQWVVTSYLLTISVLLLIWGKISDLRGKKKIFLFGFIVFTFGSGLCGLSHSLVFLVFSRILQAVGASSMMALSQGIVTATFPPKERGMALGITGTTVAIGSLVGPSLGGVLVHLAGWQSIFLINIPVGIIGTILTLIIIPDLPGNPHSGKFDIKGSLMMVSSIMLLFLGLLFVEDNVIKLDVFIPMLIASAIITYFLIRTERKAENPLIHLELFKSRVFSMGISSAYLSFIATFSTTMFIPFYLQYAMKLDTLTAGLLISAYPATTAIVAPISGWLSDRITYRPLTVTGLTINTIVLFYLTTLNTKTSFFEIIILMALLGLGVAIFQSPNNNSIMGSVPKDRLGIAGGINALFRNLGMVSGATFSVLLFTAVTKMDINKFGNTGSGFDAAIFMKGFRYVAILAGLSCLLAVIISLTRSVTEGGRLKKQ